jgi:hypothetical protein
LHAILLPFTGAVRIEASMASKIWTVTLPSGTHSIELEHGQTAGKRIVRVDGSPIDLEGTQRKLIDNGSSHRFEIAGAPMELQIQPVGFGRWYYRLKANDEWLDDPLPTAKTPTWSLFFVFLCILPVLQFFGTQAPPFALGVTALLSVGGVLGVLANSRDPLLTEDKKITRCLLLTVLVWACLMAPGVMISSALRILNPGG